MKSTHFEDNLEQFLSISARYFGLASLAAPSGNSQLLNQPLKNHPIDTAKKSLQLVQPE